MKPIGWAVLLSLVLGGGVSIAGMNPARAGFPVVVLFGANYDNNGYSALCVKCHGRNPSPYTSDNVGLGTHFVYGGAALATRNTSLEKLDAWPTAALSKYGKPGALVSQTGVAGELICESCHNVLNNTGRYRLVAADNETIDPDALCEGCHARTGPGHHPLTGDSSSIYSRQILNADNLFIRNPPTATSEATYPGPNGVNCLSCHKPHDAQTKTGARMLKRGYKTFSAQGDPVDGAGVTGLERQYDIGPTGSPRLVTDFTPLCDACHKEVQ